MRAARLTILVAFLLVVPVFSGAFAKGPSAPAGPKGLKGFLTVPSQEFRRTFPRTPAFAWQPVRGASCYEFQLATSRAFEGNSVVWSNVQRGTGAASSCTGRTLSIPAAAINLTLPWFTGKPWALYAHVRAITPQGATKWSRAYGFNMRWEKRNGEDDVPRPMSTRPGLVRWTTVEGATSYEVWYPEARNKTFRTTTNVADLREFYTLHEDPNWWTAVRWRVRAVREVQGKVPNGLPAVSYGPWSPEYAATNPALTDGKIQLGKAVSDTVSARWQDGPHGLMPALTWSGNPNPGYLPLYRVYVFTDKDCVNVVFKGSLTGAPAFAPRQSGPLLFPDPGEDAEGLESAFLDVLPSGNNEGAPMLSRDGFTIFSTESATTNSTASDGGANTSSPSTSSPPNQELSGPPPVQPHVDLPDVDNRTTRYYWTVVPVGPNPDGTGYRDLELPQDACQAGRVSTFAKLSKPAFTGSRPFVSGLTPRGRLLASAVARPTVYSTPLVAWHPVLGATSYEIQWSRTTYPWRSVGTLTRRTTATLLPLGPGRWYYRIRGLNGSQIGTPAMTWSAPAAIRVVRPTFQVSR
jgi:hypothetical protein